MIVKSEVFQVWKHNRLHQKCPRVFARGFDEVSGIGLENNAVTKQKSLCRISGEWIGDSKIFGLPHGFPDHVSPEGIQIVLDPAMPFDYAKDFDWLKSVIETVLADAGQAGITIEAIAPSR